MQEGGTSSSNNAQEETRIPKMGPEPTLLSRKEVDALYETLKALINAFKTLGVDAIVTGGSLLGAIRQHSILFCDDDIDLAIVDYTGSIYDSIVRPNLQQVLGTNYMYQIKPWEGGDRIRPKRMNNVFVDLFVMRRYCSFDDLKKVIGVKKNGQSQSTAYVHDMITKMKDCSREERLDDSESLCPFWHFATRKAVEMWTKEVYREEELFPLNRVLKMGPVAGVCGPRMPVKLLRRAFGKDCFEVFYQSVSHKEHSKETIHHQSAPSGELKPLVSAAGTWEDGQKVALEDQHYVPMQPISRKERRFTMHGKAQLQGYLRGQEVLEQQWSTPVRCSTEGAQGDLQPQTTVYMDGVFDLFHIGHLEAIQHCARLGTRVLIGVTGDVDATGYKRKPIVPEIERANIVASLSGVDGVICPCPLIVTEQFMTLKHIDLVVHGFANDQDAEKQKEFFAVPMKMGKFKRIPYYHGLSTTDRILSIKSDTLDGDSLKSTNEETTVVGKPNWFGSTLAAATKNSPEIPFDPFPLPLRHAVEPHLLKARKRREESISAIRKTPQNSKELDFFLANPRKQGYLKFDVEESPLRRSLLETLELPADIDLTEVHHTPMLKEKICRRLTTSWTTFQDCFDSFVREVCVPHFVTLFPSKKVYYQAFPCLRIIQPDEFSIGPHCDVAYGHHPCSMNYYAPLTPIEGTASLLLESRPGAEDWHPIEGDYGIVKHFASICLHWTPENKTRRTRVSLDFRLISGAAYEAIQYGDEETDGKNDVFRSKAGYYSSCVSVHSPDGKSALWEREGPLLQPDERVGYPWTVKDWDRVFRKSQATPDATTVR